MKRKIVIALFLVMCLLGFVLFGILIPAGYFKKINPHFAGTVTKINLIGMAGPEDITVDQQSGIAFISTDDRRVNQITPGSTEGAILITNLSDSLPDIRTISPASLNDFHPHGISLWTSPENKKYLFVVNHRQKDPANTIERFEWRNDSLIHLESIQDEKLMTSPNDVVAVGERAFYVTNDHWYSKKGIGRALEDYLQRPIAYVNYYNGTSFRKVAENIAYANGIAVSEDQKQLFVAATLGQKIILYNRDLASGDLMLFDEIKTNTGVDNIEVDKQGDLWVGCHPQLLKFVSHAADPNKYSPSQVIKLSKEINGKYQIEEIFLNDGSQYSGSSVAAVYKNKMLIGSVFEKSLLFCTLN